MAQKPAFANMLSGGIITDETGTGKTFKCIMICMMIWRGKEDNDPKDLLVLVPTADLMDQWCSEAEKFFKVTPLTKHSPYGQRKPYILIACHTQFSRQKKRKSMEDFAEGYTKYMPLFIQVSSCYLSYKTDLPNRWHVLLNT